MSRRSAPRPGLLALQAAVAEVRSEEQARTARAARVSAAGRDGGPLPPGRVRTGDQRLGAARQAVPVPVPSPAGDCAEPAAQAPAPAAPEGDVARSMSLVQRAQSGDADAFGDLYDQYVDMVHRYVALRVGSPQLAEDLTSETFLRAWRRIGSFTWQGRDVGAWFVTIARNLVADHYKSSRYRLELTTDDLTAGGGGPVQEGPEGEVIASLQSAALLEAVRRLGPEQQECIALRFLQGLSVSETAQVMGKNDGAIKALQYRAVKSLGRLLPDGLAP